MSGFGYSWCRWGCLLIALFLLARPERPAIVTGQEPKKTRVEEEEAPEKSKVPKKIEEIVPKENPAPSDRPLPHGGKFDIAREAIRAKNLTIKFFLERVAIPYDLLMPARGIRPYKIALLPERTLPDGKFSYFELNPDLQTGIKKELPSGTGFSLQPFEEIVLEEVEQILDPKLAKKLGGLSRDDLIEMAVQVLQSTRRWHASKVEQKVRIGKGWEAVDEKLRKRIVQLRRDQLTTSIDKKDWGKADEIALELSNYTDDPEARKDIYRLLLRKAFDSLRPDREEDYVNLRDALSQFENQAGGRNDDMARSARGLLAKKAQQYVEQAKKQAAMNQNTAAFQLLKTAEALDPDLPTIQTLRSTLRDRVLYVGVPRLPERMTPATARSDAERWATELLFESLVQPIPDAELGRRYRPVLATSLPALVPLARDFTLRKNVRWSGDGGKTVDARDVFGTLELLQKSPSFPGSEGVDLLDSERARIDDPYHVRLGFRQGVLEPLARTGFKILPARTLKTQGVEVDNDAFARSPIGSGPYRYDGREQEGPDREVAVFRANPYYGQRDGKFGEPIIREIRFVVPNLSRAASDLRDGQLHLVLDVPTNDVVRYRDDPLSSDKVNAYTLALNRRIYTLAINHRRGVLQNVDLRRGLAAAIDREGIVKDVFRPEGGKVHQALTGPFPLNCWATPEKARKPEASLFNKPLASGLLGAAAGRGRIKLNLKFPDDDPHAVRACGRIKEQIESASKKTPADSPQVEIVLEAVPGNQFFRKLDQEHDFELAYVPYDYKDDLYWLGYLLDPMAAGPGGRNYLGYLAPRSNPQTDDNDLRNSIEAIRNHRDFRDQVREGTWKLHAKFLNRMPFVPLWQLDRHIIVHKGLEMSLDNPAEPLNPERLDPATIFPGVEAWRLK